MSNVCLWKRTLDSWTLDFGLWTISEFESTASNYHRRSAHAHFFNFSGRAFDFQADAARAFDEVTLFDPKLINAVRRFHSGRVVINEITAQGTGGAPLCGILSDVLTDKEARVRPSTANFNCLAREGITSHDAGRGKAVALINLFQQ